MRTLALFALAALAFSILAGVIGVVAERRARRSLKQRTSIVLHPLTRHGFRRVRDSRSAQALFYFSLFFGFLLATYLGTLVLKIVHRFVADWF